MKLITYNSHPNLLLKLLKQPFVMREIENCTKLYEIAPDSIRYGWIEVTKGLYTWPKSWTIKELKEIPNHPQDHSNMQFVYSPYKRNYPKEIG